MKTDFFKTVKNGVIMGTVALIIICAGLYIFIKARQSSSTGLPMDTNNPTELYVNEGETLTTAKWNKLVDRTQRKDMPITDTTTQFNTNCERRRWRAGDGALYIAGRVLPAALRWKDNTTARRNVRSTNKTRFQLYNLVSTTRSYQSDYQNLSKLQYRCP